MELPVKDRLYQIPVVLTVKAKTEGEVISLIHQLERKGKKLPIEFTHIGIGQITLKEIDGTNPNL